MAGKSKFAIAEKSIRSFFEKAKDNIFSLDRLNAIHAEKRMEWDLAVSSDFNRFLEQLLKRNLLHELDIRFEGNYEKKGLYASGTATIYQAALAIHPKAYLSHYSAMFLQGITLQIPKTVYITIERSKPNFQKVKQPLDQNNVDKVFSKPQRSATSFAEYKGHRIYILNGQYTNQLGVYNEEELRVTNLERTLIDIAVRPAYSGGVAEVMNAYKRAKERLSLNKLLATLKRLDYIYPYHQAIGFYLERAGYNDAQLAPFKSLGMETDFYLTYDMRSMAYSKSWKLHYPEGI